MSDLKPGTARMSHPDPGVEDAIVGASQVPHFELQGWRYVEGDRETWPEELQRFGGEDQVYIRHPITGGAEFIPASAVPYWRERGWEVSDPEAKRIEDLEAKKVPELKELAKDRGISPIPTTKDELIDALKGTQEQDQDQDQAGDQPAQPDEEE